MERFLSCDWGTSSFRLRIVEIPALTVIGEEESVEGIAQTYESWKQSGKTGEDRLSFYFDIVHRHIKVLEKRAGNFLNDVPLVISGMASSAIGMIDLPYKKFPFFADGSDLEIKTIEASDYFPYKTTVISGAKTNDDAMRGEETQLAGCFHDDTGKEEMLFIFPGTHSKHVLVKNGKAVSLKTYMTGEFFELLSKKSILSDSVAAGTGLEENRNSFENGVGDSMQSNLLHSSFLVRTNDLFGKFTRQQNYFYLSGLLIGSEIKELINHEYSKIVLVSNETLTPYYNTAFNILNKGKSALESKNADAAVMWGQFKILKQLVKNNPGYIRF